MSSFSDILIEFKHLEDEHVENISPLLDEVELRNALVAWKSVSIKFKKCDPCPFEDEVSRWNWLWHQVEYDQAQFGKVAGLKPQNVGAILTRLQGLRLIYPDGTINTHAKQFLQAVIMSKVKPRGPGRPSSK